MPELTNPRAERIKFVKALSGRSARSRAGLFLVEGPQGVREAAKFAPAVVRDVYVALSALSRHSDIISTAQAAGLYVHTTSDEVLGAMSGDAQGILAVVTRQDPTVDDVLAIEPRLIALLSNVRDPGNAGTVIRAADAAGADAVIFTSRSVDLHNPKTVRSTAGSMFHLPVITNVDLADVVSTLQTRGLQVLAADGSGDHDLDDLLDVSGAQKNAAAPPEPGSRTWPDLADQTVWLFGNEAWGLHPEERALADSVVRVPIRGAAESLNLATAATVCLYASSRAQR